MKKVVVIVMALFVTAGMQAQVGGLIREAVKPGVEKKLAVRPLQKQLKQDKNVLTPELKDKSGEMKPEEVMSMVPQLPSPQQLAEYACEQRREKPNMLKIAANPTTPFLAKMTAAASSSYVLMMGKAKPGSVYTYDEQLLKELGISQEKYDAMSEEEKQDLSMKYAEQLQKRYMRTAERLSSDETYNKMMEEYKAVEKEIQSRYDEIDTLCAAMWRKDFAAKAKKSGGDALCEYYTRMVPMLYRAVLEAMRARKGHQLDIAKRMDEYVQKLAESNPSEVYAGFYNQSGVCAASYVNDAARLANLPNPRSSSNSSQRK